MIERYNGNVAKFHSLCNKLAFQDNSHQFSKIKEKFPIKQINRSITDLEEKLFVQDKGFQFRYDLDLAPDVYLGLCDYAGFRGEGFKNFNNIVYAEYENKSLQDLLSQDVFDETKALDNLGKVFKEIDYNILREVSSRYDNNIKLNLLMISAHKRKEEFFKYILRLNQYLQLDLLANPSSKENKKIEVSKDGDILKKLLKNPDLSFKSIHVMKKVKQVLNGTSGTYNN